MTRLFSIVLAVRCWRDALATPSEKLYYQWDGCPAKYRTKLNETVRGGPFREYENGGVRCCSDTDDTCESNVQGCKLQNWAEAKRICESANRRLCTLSELEADTCCGSGCDLDWLSSVWTSTEVKLRNIRKPCGADANSTMVLDTNKALALCHHKGTNSFQQCYNDDVQFGQAESCCKAISADQGQIWALPTSLDIDNGKIPFTACFVIRNKDGYVWTTDSYEGVSAVVTVDGCKSRNYGSNKRTSGGKDYYYNSFEGHAVRCCSYDGGECITPTVDGCESRVSWWDAHAACSQIGMRLCKKSESDDDKCCQSGCMFDVDKVWTQSINYLYRMAQKNETGVSCNYKEELSASSTEIVAFVCCDSKRECVDPVFHVCSKANITKAQLACAEIGMEICRDTNLCSRCRATKCYMDGEKILTFESYRP